MPRPIQVLIAEDSSRARQGLRALLATRPDVEIVGEVTDGREAVSLAEKCQPTVVLMDARMPQMDGLRATWLIKYRWPHIRVIVLTMYADLHEEAVAAGADDILIKGCSAEDLLEAIVKAAECPTANCQRV